MLLLTIPVDLLAIVGLVVVGSRILLRFTNAASTNKFVIFLRHLSLTVEATETKTDKTS